MRKEKYASVEQNDGSYVVKKTKKSNILAFIICVLIACVIWAYTSTVDGRQDNGSTDKSPTTEQSSGETNNI